MCVLYPVVSDTVLLLQNCYERAIPHDSPVESNTFFTPQVSPSKTKSALTLQTPSSNGNVLPSPEEGAGDENKLQLLRSTASEDVPMSPGGLSAKSIESLRHARQQSAGLFEYSSKGSSPVDSDRTAPRDLDQSDAVLEAYSKNTARLQSDNKALAALFDQYSAQNTILQSKIVSLTASMMQSEQAKQEAAVKLDSEVSGHHVTKLALNSARALVESLRKEIQTCYSSQTLQDDRIRTLLDQIAALSRNVEEKEALLETLRREKERDAPGGRKIAEKPPIPGRARTDNGLSSSSIASATSSSSSSSSALALQKEYDSLAADHSDLQEKYAALEMSREKLFEEQYSAEVNLKLVSSERDKLFERVEELENKAFDLEATTEQKGQDWSERLKQAQAEMEAWRAKEGDLQSLLTRKTEMHDAVVQIVGEMRQAWQEGESSAVGTCLNRLCERLHLEGVATQMVLGGKRNTHNAAAAAVNSNNQSSATSQPANGVVSGSDASQSPSQPFTEPDFDLDLHVAHQNEVLVAAELGYDADLSSHQQWIFNNGPQQTPALSFLPQKGLRELTFSLVKIERSQHKRVMAVQTVAIGQLYNSQRVVLSQAKEQLQAVQIPLNSDIRLEIIVDRSNPITLKSFTLLMRH